MFFAGRHIFYFEGPVRGGEKEGKGKKWKKQEKDRREGINHLPQ